MGAKEASKPLKTAAIWKERKMVDVLLENDLKEAESRPRVSE